MVTNALFNPTDEETWKTEVVPLFEAQGLIASHWLRENLDQLLDEHPEIHRSFFDNETRVFLTVNEIAEQLVKDEPFLVRGEFGEFIGRKPELEVVENFLKAAGTPR